MYVYALCMPIIYGYYLDIYDIILVQQICLMQHKSGSVPSVTRVRPATNKPDLEGGSLIQAECGSASMTWASAAQCS